MSELPPSSSDTLSYIADMAASGSNLVVDSTNSGSDAHLIQRELRNLQFVNPGENAVLADFNTRPRQRRRAFEDTETRRASNKGPHHDDKGMLVVDGEKFQLCDCLSPKCLGCHWPCEQCGSRRCSFNICQSNRGFVFKEVSEPAVRGAVKLNPYLSNT